MIIYYYRLLGSKERGVCVPIGHARKSCQIVTKYKDRNLQPRDECLQTIGTSYNVSRDVSM